jgi:DNA-binding NarL/FixJ family response regulator
MMNESVDNIAPLNPEKQTDRHIKLFVIANHDIYVDGLVRVISDHPAHQVVACSSPGSDCFAKFCQTPADMLLIEQSILEERLQTTPANTLFTDFKHHYPELRIIVFGHAFADAYVRRLLRAGVNGFIDSNTTQDMLATAIQEVYNGGYWVGRKVLEQLIYSSVEMEQIIEQGIHEKIHLLMDNLTARESEVMQLVLEGMSTKEIASSLYLSEQSVKLHLGRLFKKFDVSNRSQLILTALQRVCPANNLVNLFRTAVDKRRPLRGQRLLHEVPLDDDQLST